jgi:hypothetical protein
VSGRHACRPPAGGGIPIQKEAAPAGRLKGLREPLAIYQYRIFAIRIAYIAYNKAYFLFFLGETGRIS